MRVRFGWIFVLCLHLGGVAAFGQDAPGKNVTCTVRTTPISDAEKALGREEYDTALDLYGKMAASAPDESKAGTIRTLIEQNKVADAEALANQWTLAQPANGAAFEMMAEVLYRKGKPTDAYVMAQKAHAIAPCNARVFLLDARVENLTANFKLAKGHIDLAHSLDKQDISIHRQWISSLPRKQRIEEYRKQIAMPDQMTAKDLARLTERIARVSEPAAASECSVVGTVENARVPMTRMMDGPYRLRSWALDVKFNDKSRRLELDTGATGLVLSRSAAARLGLTREEKTTSGGIGDSGEVETSIAHVESVKMGGLEFRHCAVGILEKSSALDIDGLIGADLFRKYLLTLDYPKEEIRLSPLPKRPDEIAAKEGEEPVLHDRYVAPEMKDWTSIYRDGHDLLLPMRIGQSSEKLFLVDTGLP